VNNQIGVGDSKYVIVFDPLLRCHVIRRMRSVRVRIFNGNHGNVITRNSRTDRRRVFVLGSDVVPRKEVTFEGRETKI